MFESIWLNLWVVLACQSNEAVEATLIIWTNYMLVQIRQTYFLNNDSLSVFHKTWIPQPISTDVSVYFDEAQDPNVHYNLTGKAWGFFLNGVVWTVIIYEHSSEARSSQVDQPLIQSSVYSVYSVTSISSFGAIIF